MTPQKVLALPPKRWETTSDPKFDCIRFKGWFHRLEKRKHQIPRLEAAFKHSEQIGPVSQTILSEMFGVDSRELRDYVFFKKGVGQLISRAEQAILNDAAIDYALNMGELPLTACIEVASRIYGHNPRTIRELWEVDPAFYPTTYPR